MMCRRALRIEILFQINKLKNNAYSHVDKNEVCRAHNRSDYLEQRRRMMQWWADFMNKADSGSIVENGKREFKLVV